MSSKVNAQDRKDFDTFSKFFILKSIQIIVQSRLGEKIKTKSKTFSSSTDWFNIAIKDNNEVQMEAKKVLCAQSSTLSQNVCVEISLQTSDGDTMVLEIWNISLDVSQADITAKFSQTGYSRMGLALKSLLNVSRVTPAYKLSRRQATSNFIICYRVYLGEPYFYILGDGYQKAKVGCVPTPYGTIGVNLSYRTKLLISPQNSAKDVPFEIKDDHFRLDSVPGRPTTPKPCSAGFRRYSTSDSDTAGMSEESCTTTFSTSPLDRACTSPLPHHQSQPVKIHLKTGGSPVDDRQTDRQSVPAKQSPFKDIHRVCAFAQHVALEKTDDQDDVPFHSLLQPVKIAAKETNASKIDMSKINASDSPLSESKTSSSSQMSAPDDFVMVELKTPFAGTDANTDLGKFYRDFQSALSFSPCDEEQSVPKTLEKLTSELDYFETTMKEFDDFVSELNIDTETDDYNRKQTKINKQQATQKM